MLGEGVGLGIGDRLTPTVGAAVLAVLIATGAANPIGLPGVASSVTTTPTADPTRTFSASDHGQLLHSEPIDPADPMLAPAKARGWRVRYTSRAAADDRAIEVTGAVIVPPGPPPPGGWKLISWAHGTTGLGDVCAPSTAPGLGGQAEVIVSLISQGYAVAATDYEGLGTTGDHPYLIPKSEGRGVIDAAIAARAVVPGISADWIAYGVSQGGQAVLGAGELTDQYATGLNLKGVVALAPAPDFSPMLQDVPDLDPVHRSLFPMLMSGLRTQHKFNDDDYFGVQAEAALPRLQDTCPPVTTSIFAALPKFQVGPHTEAARAQLVQWLHEESVPQAKIDAPVMIGQGMQDDLVLPAWTNTTVARACHFGDVLDFRAYPTAGHADIGRPAAPEVRDWMVDRFAGKPARNAC